MAKGYWVARVDVSDPTGYQEYVAANAAYLLSKRTQLFAQVGFSRNQNQSNLGVTGYGMTIAPGSNQLGVAVGFAHYF